MAFSGAGAGVFGDPYQITTWAQFQEIKNDITSHFLLMNNITATNAFGVSAFFQGVLDGSNFTVDTLKTNGTNPMLFGVDGGTVKNITFDKIAHSSSYPVFGNSTTTIPTQNAVFNNVTCIGAGTLKFCMNLQTCQLIDTTIISVKEGTSITLADIIVNTTLTNVYIHSFMFISIGFGAAGIVEGSTFTDCKFISRPANRGTTATNIYTTRSNLVKTTTFTHCLFYGATAFLNTTATTNVLEAPTYIRCSLISEWYGSYSYNDMYVKGLVGNFSKCYFGGVLKTSVSYLYLGHPTLFTVEDCHVAFNLENTGTFAYYPVFVFTRLAATTQTNTYQRVFNESQIINGQGNISNYLIENGTDCFINNEKLDVSNYPNINYNQLTTAQTLNQSNFTNFDFNNVWQINAGESPKLRDVIYDPTPYFINPILSISLVNENLTTVKATITFKCVLNIDEWACYFGNALEGIEISENEGTQVAVNATMYYSLKDIGDGIYFAKVKYLNFEMINSAYHFTVADIPITTIDITPGNFITMSAPSVDYVHGTVVVGDYLYGATRGADGANFFKLKCNDYSDVTYLLISASPWGKIYGLEAIVYCSGFLWMQSVHTSSLYDLLVRVNPITLEYIVFKISENNTDNALNEPIGTDGIYLYASCYTSVRKITPPLATLAEYGYIQGDAPIALPVNSIVGTCNLLLPHPTAVARVHSIIIDSKHIYLACTATTTAAPNGIFDNIQITHLQKINKLTMLTVGDIPCPKTTDDMTQNEDYIFLAPELIFSITVVALGDEMGLIAIKKSNLAFKYLKALTSSDYGNKQTLRSCFGVQYFGDYMLVQKSNKNEAYVIDTSDIDNWGDNFPIGGASLARLRFTLNGSDFLTIPANELSLGSDGKFHANTWTNADTTVFKFNVDGFVFSYPPVVQTVLIQSLINSTTIGGEILSPGSSDVTMVGLRYGTVSTNLDQIISFENPSINFQSVLNLTPGIYYFQAYAANSAGTSYGSIVPFVVGNTVILSHDSAGAAASLRNNNCGHAVRFCKPAWGVADGTIGSATDADGNVYKTVVINEIEWAAEDLKTALYNNDDVIPEIQDNTAWSTTTDGARAGYNNVLPE